MNKKNIDKVLILPLQINNNNNYNIINNNHHNNNKVVLISNCFYHHKLIEIVKAQVDLGEEV